jgi:hypothetical protein
MPTFADSHLPKPQGWEEFEKIVCSAAKIRWSNADFTRHGRQGQAQSGVDIYGRDSAGGMIGLQCKNTTGGVTEKIIRAEVAAAEEFKPSLAKLYIATTADADAPTQAIVRAISEEQRANGKFEVFMLFWGDIWDELSRDESRLFQHFPQLRPAQGIAGAVVAGPSHDQALFQKFKSELAYEPSIRLLKEQDFGGSFPRSFIKPLFSFVDSWDTPEHEFLNQELQAELQNFYKEARMVAECIAVRTVPIGGGDMLSVYSDQQRAMGPRSEEVIREAKEMNEAANRFVPIYEIFLRLCRAKLAS